jgi:hypothetical protein
VVSSSGLPEEDVKIALEAVKRLREEEKKFTEEMTRMREFYYLGYLPIIYKIKANTLSGLTILIDIVFVESPAEKRMNLP